MCNNGGQVCCTYIFVAIERNPSTQQQEFFSTRCLMSGSWFLVLGSRMNVDQRGSTWSADRRGYSHALSWRPATRSVRRAQKGIEGHRRARHGTARKGFLVTDRDHAGCADSPPFMLTTTFIPLRSATVRNPSSSLLKGTTWLINFLTLI